MEHLTPASADDLPPLGELLIDDGAGSAPAATQNSAPFPVRASGDPRRQPGQVTGAQWGPGTISARSPLSSSFPTGAVSEITSSATVWMYVRKVDQALARDLVPAS
jgi:hypothetical protein